MINVRTPRLIPADQALGHHDLHQLEHSGIARAPRLADPIVHLANRARPSFLEDVQDRALGFRWRRNIGLIHNHHSPTVKVRTGP
jgi:hypothetical protein